MADKVRIKLEKLETRNRVAGAIMRDNNNRTALNKQKLCTKLEIEVAKISTIN